MEENLSLSMADLNQAPTGVESSISLYVDRRLEP